MVNDQPVMNLEAFDTQIASVVSEDDRVSNLCPLLRLVESLINVTVETER